MSVATPTRDRHEQARRALGIANERRIAKSTVRRDLRSGNLTLAEVTLRRPDPLRPMPLFALLLELPGFGPTRLVKLNRHALVEGINLALTLGEASAYTLEWMVGAVTGLDDITVPEAPDDGDWRSLALALDTLVLEHERSVRDESLPAARWAWADEELHRQRAVVMGHTPPREGQAR